VYSGEVVAEAVTKLWASATPSKIARVTADNATTVASIEIRCFSLAIKKFPSIAGFEGV
jgi:hypothetical protein